MKQLKTWLLTAAIVATSSAVHAQTAEEIINKYFDAIGGKDKISQVTSVYMEATAQVMGSDNPVKITVLNGKGYKSETNFNGSTLITCVTDKGGWSINPFAGGSDAAPMTEQEYKLVKDNIYLGGVLFNYSAAGGKVELEGTENGAYKIKLTSADSTTAEYYIDTATYYLTKVVKQGTFQGQPTEITIGLSNFKKTDAGYFMPFTTDIDFGGSFSMSTTVTKAEINKQVDPAIFEMPK